jgi:formamidopyrimidine-DNA glycosylase
MPELAEVEFYRRRWDAGLGATVCAVKVHPRKRVFRGTAVRELQQRLPGAVLVRSEARGKQMIFEFSGGLWLGLHLGMTGQLLQGPAQCSPGKHDHLVLSQAERNLIFRDPRQFGRVRFAWGDTPPDWWTKLPPAIVSRAYQRSAMRQFLSRHRKLPLKAALLLQTGFPGVGNWMADEILWRAKLDPKTPSGGLAEADLARLWRSVRWVCRQAIRHIGADFSDPPKGWLFHERWQKEGVCPLHKRVLERATIGGRTTSWCRRCQPEGQAS